jgi:hypothetical protein
MSEDYGNGASGTNGARIARSELIDELVLTFDRGDGTMKIGGKAINLDVALDMCQRGVRFFETQLRIQAAAQAKQQMVDTQRVQDLLERTRGGRG